MNRPFLALRPLAALALSALLAPSALAQDAVPANPPRPGDSPSEQNPPDIGEAELVDINFVEADLLSLVKYFARATGRNFILDDTRELEGKKITIISNRKVSPSAAYEAFMSSLEVHGLSVVRVGSMHKIIESGEAQKKPGRPGEGGAIRATDQYITQIIQLQNVSVKDVREIVDNLASENAKVLAYAPANTLILTDTGHNIRRIYDIVNQLDVAAPKSSLVIYPIAYAEAAQVKTLIEELYGTADNQEAEEDPRACDVGGSASHGASHPCPSRAWHEDSRMATGPVPGAGREARWHHGRVEGRCGACGGPWGWCRASERSTRGPCPSRGSRESSARCRTTVNPWT